MMRQLGISMSVKCDKAKILEKLKANLANHSKLVAEAREGYAKKAEAELTKLLGKVREGKVNNLTFTMAAPRDYSSIYKTAINMLESHTEGEITLGASEYRQFVEDEWDWVRDFATVNSAYSVGTQMYAAKAGFDINNDD